VACRTPSGYTCGTTLTSIPSIAVYARAWDSAACLVEYGRIVADALTRGGWTDVAERFADALNAGPVAADLEWRFLEDAEQCLDLAAQVIADDPIIAWFAGRMEFGPRALGNRSIMALPSGRDIKNRLNHAVKLRESFRPFARRSSTQITTSASADPRCTPAGTCS
jgi:hypothetical protein